MSILKHFQVISSDSRQMRKNAQIDTDRPTDRQTDRQTDGQTWSGNESLITTKNIYFISFASIIASFTVTVCAMHARYYNMPIGSLCACKQTSSGSILLKIDCNL